jgi:hypothetical protein
MHAVMRTRNWAEHSISENTLSHLKRDEVSTTVLGVAIQCGILYSSGVSEKRVASIFRIIRGCL